MFQPLSLGIDGCADVMWPEDTITIALAGDIALIYPGNVRPRIGAALVGKRDKAGTPTRALDRNKSASGVIVRGVSHRDLIDKKIHICGRQLIWRVASSATAFVSTLRRSNFQRMPDGLDQFIRRNGFF